MPTGLKKPCPFMEYMETHNWMMVCTVINRHVVWQRGFEVFNCARNIARPVLYHRQLSGREGHSVIKKILLQQFPRSSHLDDPA